MTLPIFTWPLAQANYTYQDFDKDTIAVQLDGGAPAYRENVLENFVTVPVGFILQGDDIDAFFTFYETTIDRGSLPFQIDLLLDGYEAVKSTHKVYFMANSVKVSVVSDSVIAVTADLEVKPNEYDVEFGLAIVGAYNELGHDWRTLFPPLDDVLNTIVNVDLPGVGL